MAAAPGTGVVDELVWTLILLAAALFFLSGPIVAWTTRSRVRRLEGELAELRARLGAVAAPTAAEPGPARAAPAEPPPPEPAPPEPPLPEPEPAGSGATAPAAVDLEGRLAQRWLVWLGGLALVLGGLFLAGWAVEQGLLGPRARTGLAYLAGVALLVLAEQAWRRRPAGAGTGFLVPAALAAGAVAALYGATLAAHLLYGLVPRAVALALLALSAGLSVALALRYGALLAALGGVGALAAPALVAGDEPAAWGLALYLAAVVASLALVAGLRRWAWLAWLDLVGGTVWAVVLLAMPAAWASPAAPGLVLLALGVAGLGLLARAAGGRALAPAAALMLLAAALLELPLQLLTAHARGAVASLLLLTAAAVLVGLAAPASRWVAAVLAAVTLVAAALVQPPVESLVTSHLRDPSVALEPAFWVAPEGRPVAAALAGVALGWALIGAAALRRSPHPGFWAALSGFVPLAALALAYARLEGLAVSPPWSALALALALLATLAAQRLAGRPALLTALAAYAVAAAGGLALGLAMALEDAWLDLALALEVAALAHVAARLDLAALRLPAAVLGLVLLARILLGVELSGPTAPLPALAVAHLLPLLALAAAAWTFRRVPAPPAAGLEELLQGLAVLLWLLLVTAVLRRATGATDAADLLRLPMLASATLAWLLTPLLLWRLGADPAGRALRLAGHLVLALGCLQLAALVLAANPALTGEPVGPWPVLNLLLPAYLGPAAIALRIARSAGGGPGDPPAVLARPAAAAALALAFLWLTLEVRHAFQGTRLDGPTGDAEWLAWSAAWLAFAAGLLFAGIRRRLRWLRAAALLVGALAILKAFLFDLAELDGLYRAVSFLALGLCLVGVGFLYRRYVAEPPPREPGGPARAAA